MTLRDLLKKKEKVEQNAQPADEQPKFLFMRSDTHGHELISPPSFSSEDHSTHGDGSTEKKSSRLFGRSRSASVNSTTSASSRVSETSKSKKDSPKSKRLSQRLHLKKSEPSSASVPSDLPEIQVPAEGDNDGGAGIESQWEKRATMLARQNETTSGRPITPVGSTTDLPGSLSSMMIAGPGAAEKGVVSSKNMDDNIQEAIRLHEAGELETATQMFGRLADPNGGNNALSQVLYGLALRHGWGCTPDPAEAVRYLSLAASNAAGIEDMALQAGMKKGGAAKGELVLAIYELANCFRHGWGVAVDPFAAKQYYETAANLGDTDAMNEVAWCYEHGFGVKKKDKFAAAKYLRLAETTSGNKILGNSWIWKEKYDPPGINSPSSKKK